MSDPVIAVIDIGSNSFHLLITKFERNKLITLYKKREIMRLGSEFGTKEKKISPKEFKNSIKILRKFKSITNKYNASIYAKATSALREAKNKNKFINKVNDELGIKIKLITGKKEAEYIYLGMLSALNINNKKALCFDIGGGSTEIIYGKKGNPLFLSSIKIGAVRLTLKYFKDFNLFSNRISKCRKYVIKKIKSSKEIDLNCKYDIAVGSSGTIHAAAGMIYFYKYNKPLEKPNGCIFTKEEFENIYNLVLNKKTTFERLGIKGLEKKRADIIPSGLIILSVIFELFKIKKMVLSEGALRYGMAYSKFNKFNKGSNKS